MEPHPPMAFPVMARQEFNSTMSGKAMGTCRFSSVLGSSSLCTHTQNVILFTRVKFEGRENKSLGMTLLDVLDHKKVSHSRCS